MTNAFLNRCIAPRVLSRRPLLGNFKQCLALLFFAAFASSGLGESSRNAPLLLTPTPTPPPLSYNDGDLFLGFRATDGTSDYLINLGQPAQFVNATPGSTFPVQVGNTNPDLVATFGSDWCTRIDPNTGRSAVLWAVTGGRQIAASGDPANVLYSTNSKSNPWPRRSDTAQSFTTSLIAALGNTFAGNNPTVNNPQGLVQSASSSNSYASFQPGGVNSGGISFLTWNPWNDAAPATTLFFNRIAPGSGASTVLGTFTLACDGTLSFTAAMAVPTPTPTPPPLANISGNTGQCAGATNNPLAGATLTLTGDSAGSTLSDASGNYLFTGLVAAGNYTVTPTKAARLPGSAGINTTDVIATQRHFLGLGTLLTGCRLTAADCAGSAGVNTQDVIAIQRFFLGLSTGIGNVGKYKFTPTSLSYAPLGSTQTAQNFTVVVFGDDAVPYANPRPGGPAPDSVDEDRIASTVAAVSLPAIAADRTKTDFTAAVTTSVIAVENRLVGFQGDFTFDERVVTFDGEPVQKAGLTAGNWNVSGNVLDGPGPIRTLRISAYSLDFSPLSGAGTLFELRMTRMTTAARNTQLIWAAPPDQFIFIDADLNSQTPGYAASGGIATSGTRK